MPRLMFLPCLLSSKPVKSKNLKKARPLAQFFKKSYGATSNINCMQESRKLLSLTLNSYNDETIQGNRKAVAISQGGIR